MDLPPHHDWNPSYGEAVAVQRELSEKVAFQPLPAQPRIVAGFDLSYASDSDVGFAAAIAFDVREQRVIEVAQAQATVTFPYQPGLLSFREVPLVLKALENLQTRPEVLLLDGHGIAHPRHCGLACHVGVLADMPAIGCAKKRLVGRHDPVGLERGAQADLVYRKQVVGRVVRTRTNVKPIYVSVGHRADLEGAVALALQLAPRYRHPEPLRQAHKEVTRMRQARA